MGVAQLVVGDDMRVLRAAASIHAVMTNVALARPLARVLEDRLASRVTEHTVLLLAHHLLVSRAGILRCNRAAGRLS